MSSNESAAYKIMRSLDVDYVLIIFGGVIGYSGDDINKFLWMVRIAEGEHPKDIRVSVWQQHIQLFSMKACSTLRHSSEINVSSSLSQSNTFHSHRYNDVVGYWRFHTFLAQRQKQKTTLEFTRCSVIDDFDTEKLSEYQHLWSCSYLLHIKKSSGIFFFGFPHCCLLCLCLLILLFCKNK